MTKEEYADYQARFERGMKRLSVNCLSTNEHGERFFSWRPCEVCHSRLGGDRYDCTGYNPTDGSIEAFEACTDCVYYAAYGQLPDGDMPDKE